MPATLPELACQLFGPERPDPKPGEPAGRPVDPDPTGGFYQPVLAWLDGDVVVGGVRITCGLFNVSPSVSTDFTGRYQLNENPVIERLELVASDGTVTPLEDGTEASVRAGASYTVRAVFPACPSEPVCGDGICSSGETTSDAFPELSLCAGRLHDAAGLRRQRNVRRLRSRDAEGRNEARDAHRFVVFDGRDLLVRANGRHRRARRLPRELERLDGPERWPSASMGRSAR